MDLETLAQQVKTISDKYAQKYQIERNNDWYVLKLQEELGELTQSYLMLKGKGRSKGKSAQERRTDFEDEIADVLCHVLLLAKVHNVDIQQVIERSWLSYSNE